MIRVITVTPRNSIYYLERIEENDPCIHHLCLELVHWKFDNLMSWVYKVHSTCRHVTLMKPPPITIHGFSSEISSFELTAITKSGALWMPREEEKNLGIDCATIIREMFSCRGIPMIDEYEYDGIDNAWKPKEVPPSEFAGLLSRTLLEIDGD